MIREVSVAELLLDADRYFQACAKRGEVMPAECDGGNHQEVVARVKIARDMASRGTAFVFRAIAEGWSPQRLVRELY